MRKEVLAIVIVKDQFGVLLGFAGPYGIGRKEDIIISLHAFNQPKAVGILPVGFDCVCAGRKGLMSHSEAERDVDNAAVGLSVNGYR